MKPHRIVGTAGSQGIGLGLRSGTTGMVVLGLMSLYLLLVPVINVVPGVEVYDGRRLAQLALLAVGLGVAPDLPDLPHRKEIYTDWTGSYDLRPRYWQQGFIGYETDRYPTEPVHPK